MPRRLHQLAEGGVVSATAFEVAASLGVVRHEAAHAVEAWLAGVPVEAILVRDAVDKDGAAGRLALDWPRVKVEVLGIAADAPPETWVDVAPLSRSLLRVFLAGYLEAERYPGLASWPPTWAEVLAGGAARGDLGGLSGAVEAGGLVESDYTTALVDVRQHRMDARYASAVHMLAGLMIGADRLSGALAEYCIAATYAD